VNPIAIVLILFAQLDIESLTKSVTDISDRLTVIEKLLEKPEPDKLIPIPDGEQSGLQLVDSKGLPLANAQDGRQFKIIASAAGKWSWQTLSPEDDVDVTESPDRLVCTLRNGAELYVAHVTETNDLATRIVRCGNGPRPPPDDEKIVPVKQRKLFIAVVEDVRNRSPETAQTLSDLEAWNAFRDKGHEWRFYDQSTMETRGVRAVKAAGATVFDPPRLVIHDLEDGSLVTAVTLPTMDEVQKLVTKLGGK
jgi:hypothetical protein